MSEWLQTYIGLGVGYTLVSGDSDLLDDKFFRVFTALVDTCATLIIIIYGRYMAIVIVR